MQFSASSAELCAGRDAVAQHEKIQLLVLFCGQQHAIGLLTHHLARRQVGDGDDRLADQLLRLVILCDAGEDLARRARAVVELELEELAALLDVLAGEDLAYRHVDLAEVVKRDIRQELDSRLLLCLGCLLLLLDLGELLRDVDTLEQDGRFADRLTGLHAVEGGKALNTLVLDAELCEDLVCGIRQVGLQLNGCKADGLDL